MSNYVEMARRLRPMIEKAAQGLDDTDALNAVELYPAWRGDGVSYGPGRARAP